MPTPPPPDLHGIRAYLAEGPTAIRRRLRSSGISAAEIARALEVLRKPDPAGVIQEVLPADVERVAAHMNPRQPGFLVQNRSWTWLIEGLLTSHAVYFHELVEIDELDRLSVSDPVTLNRDGDEYWEAHAWACWQESLYWQAWSKIEGTEVSASSFLVGHPLRRKREQERIRHELRRRGILISGSAPIELKWARGFYNDKGMGR